MDREFRNGRLLLARTPAEKEPLLQRLRRIEGQVRGLQQMVESDRYCLDEVQQVNAITAATRELALLLMAQHLRAGLDHAIESGDSESVMADLVPVLRAGLRQ